VAVAVYTLQAELLEVQQMVAVLVEFKQTELLELQTQAAVAVAVAQELVAAQVVEAWSFCVIKTL
jgi:hypothetical protein